MQKYIAPLLSALLLAGCAATGPTSSPEFPSLVRSAVPEEAGKAIMFGTGNWYPNTIGFADIRTTAGYSPTSPVSGVIVVTTNAVVIEQWDDRTKKFEVMKLLKLADLTDASLDTFMASTRLVLKSADYSHNSFDFTSGEFLDGSKTAEMAAYLQRHIGKPAAVN